jgi:signal transduction histidine kinase
LESIVSLQLDPRPRAPAPEREREREPAAPLTLRELLDERSRRLLAAAGDALAAPLHVTTPAGEPLVGGPVPEAVIAHAAGELAPVAALDGEWRARQLVVDGVGIGVLALGPLAAAPAPGVFEHLERLAADLLAAAIERHAVDRAHSATIEDADAELHQKNARLALAVARLEELDKIKSNFLATVSHELRTPLTSVIGYSEMLLEGLAGPLNSEQREYVTTVMEKGEQLLSIITGILDISRIEAGGVNLDRSRFDVGEAIVSALSTVAPTARRKRLTVEAELPPSLPPVHGDRDKIRQVLVNLLGNAVKFTPEGGRVTVRAEPASLKRPGSESARDDRRGLRVAVTDSGIGIPPEAMAKIFDPFFQVDSSSTREYGGTGLGLSIVRSFIHAHGGAVWVESLPGAGSTFFFTVPLAE